MASPLEIQMILHFYAVVTPFPNVGAPVQREIISSFLDRGLIYPDSGLGSCYRTTSLGEQYVEALCDVPKPERPPLDKAIAFLVECHTSPLGDGKFTVHPSRQYFGMEYMAAWEVLREHLHLPTKPKGVDDEEVKESTPFKSR